MAAGFQAFLHPLRYPESIGMDSYPSVGPVGPPVFMSYPHLADEAIFL